MKPQTRPDSDLPTNRVTFAKPASELFTSRLILRDWRESDLAPFAAMNADTRVREFFPGLLSEEESNSSVARFMPSAASDGFTFWAMEERATGAFMGFTGIIRADFKAAFTPCVEIGWRLSPSFWGRGFATEAAQAALRFGFETALLTEIVAFAAHSNLASQRVMQRIGMTRDADFIHPKMQPDHPLQPCVLYRLPRTLWLERAH